MNSSSNPKGTEFWETDDYRGAGQRNLNAALIAFSSAFLAIRLYVRLFMTKSPGWDDGLAGLAWVSPVSSPLGGIDRTNIFRHVWLFNQHWTLLVSGSTNGPWFPHPG